MIVKNLIEKLMELDLDSEIVICKLHDYHSGKYLDEYYEEIEFILPKCNSQHKKSKNNLMYPGCKKHKYNYILIS